MSIFDNVQAETVRFLGLSGVVVTIDLSKHPQLQDSAAVEDAMNAHLHASPNMTQWSATASGGILEITIMGALDYDKVQRFF